jgi:hypothetical protein
VGTEAGVDAWYDNHYFRVVRLPFRRDIRSINQYFQEICREVKTELVDASQSKPVPEVTKCSAGIRAAAHQLCQDKHQNMRQT